MISERMKNIEKEESLFVISFTYVYFYHKSPANEFGKNYQYFCKT